MLALFLPLLCVALEGRWIGHYSLAGRDVFVRVEGGELLTPGRFPAGGELESARVLLTMRGEESFDAGPLAFEGTRDGGTISGSVRAGDARGTFELVRLAELDEAALRRFSGQYAFDDGSYVDVSYLKELHGLLAVSFPSGRIGPLEAIAPTTFVRGPTLVRRLPADAEFRFEADAAAVTVGAERARRVRYPTEEVEFVAGATELKGTLTLPLGSGKPGKHPAVVLVHGGGPQSRADFGWVPAFFARLGVVVLAFDKRAEWASATFDDLADDVLAGMDLVLERDDIDPKRVGLYASSNGAWVAPIAAAKRPDAIAWVIARSASGLTNRANIVFEAETDVRAHGFGEREVAALRALHAEDMAVVAAGGEGWDELRAALARAAREPWFALARLPGSILERNAANRERIESWIRFARQQPDPRALWPRVAVPVLIQLGGADEYVPAEESARILRAALSGNADATVSVYPNGTHPLFESSGGRVPDLADVTRFTPGYLTDLEAWIVRVTGARR